MCAIDTEFNSTDGHFLTLIFTSVAKKTLLPSEKYYKVKAYQRRVNCRYMFIVGQQTLGKIKVI